MPGRKAGGNLKTHGGYSMNKSRIAAFALAACLLAAPACTNMSKTQQGGLSGAAVGAGVGAGIGALTGGSGTIGALIGGAAGGILGGIYGHSQEK